MPLIEFKCIKCGKVFEELVKTDEKKPKCPDCGGETEQNYNGRCWVNSVHKGECTGNCATCKGCH